LACFFSLPLTGARAEHLVYYQDAVFQSIAQGNSLEFIVRVPSSSVHDKPGFVFFKGTNVNNFIEGDVFFGAPPGCGRSASGVQGTVADDGHSATLYGNIQLLDPDCRPTLPLPHLFYFTDHPVVKPPGTLICVHPIFAEEVRLRGMIDGTPQMTQRVANAINYLRSAYCRHIDGHLQAHVALQAGGINCWQYIAKYKGEDVYYGDCSDFRE
jgi:hypothetical protein